MKKIRTIAALRKAAANRRAVTGWSAARPDVEKPAAWVLRMPFDRVTEALARGMEVYTPKVRKGEKVAATKYKPMVVGDIFQRGDEWNSGVGWETAPGNLYGHTYTSGCAFKYRRPIGKATK